MTDDQSSPDPMKKLVAALLPGVSLDAVYSAYERALGKEISSGKFFSPESSSALVANCFGWFCDRPGDLPPLPGGENWGWPASAITLEATMRFPWRGGRHPWLDVAVETATSVIGIESKRYEPYRSDEEGVMSKAYWRPVWGDRMVGYMRLRDRLRDTTPPFFRLDAAQLMKHAFGLRTAVQRGKPFAGKRPVLYYLYAEPTNRADGTAIPASYFERHREEITKFATEVAGDEVVFASCSYRDLLAQWLTGKTAALRAHAMLIQA